MSYIDDIFNRLDLQHIREFLLYGVECAETTDEGYKQRLETADKRVCEKIKTAFSGDDEDEKVMSEIYKYTSVTADVYMEIGIKCGAVLVTQLLSKTKTA